MGVLTRLYPVAILQDRYNGTYSGGAWIAIAEADERLVDADGDTVSRYMDAFRGAHGSDTEAMEYWQDRATRPWVAVGDTPDLALMALIAAKHR